ncbi:MAG: imidazole glycerol phosphate synthase subunit HisH [Deltaproteobacteria bacterium]|nr:imidazole glycerol phosphate synthase subunit HisH [Deltaproteobacteria bacterium]
MIVVVDYGLCNVGSVLNMLKRIGAAAEISSDPARVGQADKLILPGVGAFDNGMANIERLGLLPVLDLKVRVEKTPILGICLGMQLLTRRSEEGDRPGLGWIEADTRRFRLEPSGALRVPHMGWNELKPTRSHPLLEGLGHDARFYFVHSYHAVCDDVNDAIANAHYGYDFAAVIARDNVMGTQFHPEKSHRFGLALLRNFVEAV